MPLSCFWGRYRGGAGQLLANFFPFVSNSPDVFAEVNLAQFFARADLKTELTSGKTANLAPKVGFGPFRALSYSFLTLHCLG